MLKDDDKNAIDDCIKRPVNVWEAVKSIITAEKYTWYLESLAKVKIIPNIAKRKEKWDSMTTNKRSEYMGTEEYDIDLRRVLQQVARVLGGIDADDFPIGAFIGNWRNPNTQTILRQTAFKAAVAFRFTIDETRDLLFNVLTDKEQLDFNPRLVDEMIYGYAIIQNLPLVSAQEMIESSKIKYITNVFGTDYQVFYEKLINCCDTKYNVLDAKNITKTAFLLAALIEVQNGTFNDETIALFTEGEADSNLNDEAADDADTVRIPKLNPDVSVALHCYDYANAITQKEPPQYRNSQTTIADLQRMLELAQSFLNAAIELAELESKQKLYHSMYDFLDVLKHFANTQPADSLFSPVDYLPLLSKTDLGNYSTSDFNTMIKDVFIKHFHLESQERDGEGQRVGEYHPYILPRAISEHTDYYAFFFFTLMTAVRDLRAVTLRNCMKFWPIYIRMNEVLLHAFFDFENIGKKAWDYEQEQKIKEEDDDYTFTMIQLNNMLNKAQEIKKENGFTGALLHSFHIYENFRGLISRGKEEFIGSIEDSGKVLNHVINITEDEAIIAETIISADYDEEKSKQLGNKLKRLLKNRHAEGIINNILPYYVKLSKEAPEMIDKILEGLCDNDSNLDYTLIKLLDEERAEAIMNFVKSEHGNWLFRISDSGIPIPENKKQYKQSFYSSARFKRQHIDKSEPYTRNDILKLAFWKFVGELDDDDLFESTAEAELRKDEFISYFNDNVAIITCCARINERNSLDRFLLLCLEHTDPILFLEEAIAYSDELRIIF